MCSQLCIYKYVTDFVCHCTNRQDSTKTLFYLLVHLSLVARMTYSPPFYSGAGTGTGTGRGGEVASAPTGSVAPAVVTEGGHAARSANPTAIAAAAGTETGTESGHPKTKVRTLKQLWCQCWTFGKDLILTVILGILCVPVELGNTPWRQCGGLSTQLHFDWHVCIWCVDAQTVRQPRRGAALRKTSTPMVTQLPSRLRRKQNQWRRRRLPLPPPRCLTASKSSSILKVTLSPIKTDLIGPQIRLR